VSWWSDPQARTARTDHRCIWCGQPIAKGEAYIYQSGRFDGYFQSNHWHYECFAGYKDDGNGFDAYEGERPGRVPV